MNGAVRLGFGSNAGSGVIIDQERSRSVGLSQKKQAREAHGLFVQHVAPYGHEKSIPVPSLLKDEQDQALKSVIE